MAEQTSTVELPSVDCHSKRPPPDGMLAVKTGLRDQPFGQLWKEVMPESRFSTITRAAFIASLNIRDMTSFKLDENHRRRQAE